MTKFFFERSRMISFVLFLFVFQNSYAVFKWVDHDTRSFALGELYPSVKRTSLVEVQLKSKRKSSRCIYFTLEKTKTGMPIH